MLPRYRKSVHPGEVLREEFLRPMGITQTQLARNLGWTHAKVNEIINGKRGITPEAALSLSDVLGTSADVWLNLQKTYDLWIAKQNHEEKPKLRKQVNESFS